MENLMASGGTRKGAGRKQLYGEPTVFVATKVPASKVIQFKKAVKEILKKWELKKKV